jgi:hypothetical protein
VPAPLFQSVPHYHRPQYQRSSPCRSVTMSNTTNPADIGVQARRVGVARHLTPAGLIAVAWVGAGVGLAFVCLRSFARWREAKRFFTDDYWMWVACLFLLINAVLQTMQTHSLYYLVDLSSGRVQPGPELLVQGNKYVRYEFTIIGFFWTVTWCVKGSFLALYYRLLEGLPHYRKMWYVCVAFTICAYIGNWFASAWTCHPPSAYFKFGKYGDHPRDISANIEIRPMQQTDRQSRFYHLHLIQYGR